MKAGELFVDLALRGLPNVSAGLNQLGSQLKKTAGTARGFLSSMAKLTAGGLGFGLLAGGVGLVSTKLVKMAAHATDAFLSLGKLDGAGEATRAAAEQYDNLKNTLVDIGMQFAELVNSALGTSDILTSITDGLKAGWEQVKEPVYSLIAALKSMWKAMYEIYTEIVGSILNAIGLNISNFGSTYLKVIKNIYDRVRFFFDNWRDFLKLFRARGVLAIQNLWERIKTWATNLVEIVEWALDNWQDIFKDFGSFIGTVFENLWTNIKNGWKAIVAFFSGEEVEFNWTPLTEGFKSSIKELPKLTQANIQETTEEIAALEAKLGQKWQEFKATPTNIPTVNTPNKSSATGWQIKGEMKLPTASTGSPFIGISDLAKQSQEASLKRIQERQLAELQKNVNVLLQFYDLAKNTGIKLASGAPAVYQ
jgi:hypothetical protein